MLYNIKISRVTVDDAETLSTFSIKTFYASFAHLNNPASMDAYASKAFNIEKLSREINNPYSEFYFAYLDNKLVGHLKLNTGPAQTEFQENNALEVERIYVSQDYQDNKIGQQLLAFAIECAKTRRHNYIWLGVWENNPRAISFYKRNGFTLFSSHKFMLGDEEQTDLLMKQMLIG